MLLLLMLFVDLVVQAKDKARWQKLFTHFCSRAANEEEEIAHKLLGEQFRVSSHSAISPRKILQVENVADDREGRANHSYYSAASRPW